MVSTLALGALRIARGAGGEGGGREREPRRAGEGRLSLESKLLRPDRACGQQKVKGGHGSITASSSASCSASIITLNLGVGCAPSCWPIFGFRNLLGARRGRRGQFSVQSE